MVNFNDSSYDIMEDDGPVVIPIVMSQKPSMPVQVELNAIDVTATSMYVAASSQKYYMYIYVGEEDYIGGKRTVTIPTDTMLQSFTINITDDYIAECPESFNITIVSVTGIGVTTGNFDNVKVAILDDDGN